MTLCVLHVVRSLRPEAGSIAIALDSLVEALSRAGVENTIVASDTAGSVSTCAVVEEYAPNRARKLLVNADLVHFHGLDRAFMSPLAKAARDAHKPYVLTPAGALSANAYEKVGVRGRIARWFQQDQLPGNAAALIALNELEATELADRYGRDKTHLLPYGLDFEEYEKEQEPPPGWPVANVERYVLFLGPLDPLEGLVPLLRAIADLGRDFRGWHLVLAGPQRAEWRPQIEAAVHRKGGSDRVTFVDDPDIQTQRAWIAHASLLVAPSLHVRCPISVQQGIASGVVVVASDKVSPGGPVEGMRLCRPVREELHRTLSELITMPDDERSAMANKARAAGKALFDWSALIDRTTTLYTEVVQRSAGVETAAV